MWAYTKLVMMQRVPLYSDKQTRHTCDYSTFDIRPLDPGHACSTYHRGFIAQVLFLPSCGGIIDLYWICRLWSHGCRRFWHRTSTEIHSCASSYITLKLCFCVARFSDLFEYVSIMRRKRPQLQPTNAFDFYGQNLRIMSKWPRPDMENSGQKIWNFPGGDESYAASALRRRWSLIRLGNRPRALRCGQRARGS
jgi:hypothetical protein